MIHARDEEHELGHEPEPAPKQTRCLSRVSVCIECFDTQGYDLGYQSFSLPDGNGYTIREVLLRVRCLLEEDPLQFEAFMDHK